MHTQTPGRERGSGRKPQPRDPQRAKKEAVSWHITLQCAGSELAAPAGNVAQSASSLLSGAAARAAVWSRPLSSCARARPVPTLPPRPAPAGSPRFTRSSFPTSSFPLFHLLQAHLPLPESQLQRVSGLRMRRSAGAGGCRSSGPRNPRLLSNISPLKEALGARGSLLVLPAPG